MAQPIWRGPSAEHRAAAVVHAVGHSVGLVFTTTDPGDGAFSFKVDGSGVTELAGWGFAGPTIDLEGVPNPPPSLLAVHTVIVTAGDGQDDEAAVRAGMRALVDEHLARYAECGVWAAPDLPRGLADWVRAGCPDAAVAEGAPAGGKT